MRSRIVTLLLACLILFATACAPSEGEKAATFMAFTQAAQQTATENVNRALAAVLTGTASVPTITLTPTQTATPTETATPTATPIPMAEVIADTVFVRTGPGTIYKSLTKLSKGDQVEVVGRNLESDWLAVTLPSSEQGWLPLIDVKINFEMASLLVFDTPPTPIQKVTITITNNVKDYWFWIKIQETNQRYVIETGNSTSIILDVGTYNIAFIYMAKSGYVNGCTKTVYLSYHRNWVFSSTGGDICSQFN
ncbi:MAG: SH3 domain-containing protein [Anaerolineae bacterium]|nr:SH3 domain-containing protein [Anaerolineae bacterium]